MFDVYALIISPILLISFGLFGYLVKSKLLTKWKLNSYFIGMLSFFTIFEIISIPSILFHLSFKKFKWIILIITFFIFVYSLFVYYQDYKKNKINHKFRFYIRYKKNKTLYKMITLIIILFTVLFLFFPFTRLRDDDLHWIIAIKDNITSNRLLQVYPENGSMLNFFEIYVFNASTLFYSFVVSIFNVNVLAFSLITVRIVWLFTFLFSLKDFIYFLIKKRTWRNSIFLICVITLLLFTNFSNFYEMPFIVTYSTVGQRLSILLLIPLVHILLTNMSRTVLKQDYILYMMLALVSIFFATTLPLIMMAFVFFIAILNIIKKRYYNLKLIAVFTVVSLSLTAITIYIYSKTGPQNMFLVDEFCLKYGCEVYNVKINNLLSHDNVLNWISSSYFIRFLIPIVLVLFSKQTFKEFKYIAWFLIFVTILLNPISVSIFKHLNIPIILVERINYYYTFLGYILYFPAISIVINSINSKSDLVKIFQVLLVIYVAMSTIYIDTIYKRNVNFANVYNFTFFSPNDRDKDKYYPIDKSQVQTLDALRSVYDGKYYVFTTSVSAINYRVRLFDSNAMVITPRERERDNLNFKDDWYSCLNTNVYLSSSTLRICKDTVNQNNKTAVILYRGYKNNFTKYVENNFKMIYENNKYIIYKRKI